MTTETTKKNKCIHRHITVGKVLDTIRHKARTLIKAEAVCSDCGEVFKHD